MRSHIYDLCRYAKSFPVVQKKARRSFVLETKQMRPRRYRLLFSLFIFQVVAVFSQQLTYDNFEGGKFIYYGERSGVLDTSAKNPMPDQVNGSKKCALYVRNGSKKFDNIKMRLPARLDSVDAYATYLGVPPKLKMKL